MYTFLWVASTTSSASNTYIHFISLSKVSTTTKCALILNFYRSKIKQPVASEGLCMTNKITYLLMVAQTTLPPLLSRQDLHCSIEDLPILAQLAQLAILQQFKLKRLTQRLQNMVFILQLTYKYYIIIVYCFTITFISVS